MKKIYLFLMTLLPMVVTGQERIMVIADPHVFASSLHDNGAAFQEMMNSQRKMIDLSEEAWKGLVQTAMSEHADLLLIPGDLTKDGELASHNTVRNDLAILNNQGIKTLVIPGNHDIGGNAYSYMGEEKTEVDVLQNAKWWEYYESVCSGLISKDANSHSYAAEPLEGLTVLGVDGAHDNAGTGSLSEETLGWILAQADAAKAKGNMIIAMSHWQILEHFDKQGSLESSCRLANADAIRDSLMQHGVHLVLTGHFHVNGITTFRDTTGLTHDSIVEITTGSPITYPCPYRWLTLSNDRALVAVETEDIADMSSIEGNLHTYSREWMRVHTENLIPTFTNRLWGRMDEAFEHAQGLFGALDDVIIPAIKGALQSIGEEKRVQLVQTYLGPTIVDLYLLHSDANEPEHPEAQQLAADFLSGMENMIHAVTDEPLHVNSAFGMKAQQQMMISFAKDKATPYLQSLVQDVTHYGTIHADRTDDLQITLVIHSPKDDDPTGMETNMRSVPIRKRLINGQLYIQYQDRLYNVLGLQMQQL